MAIPRGPNQRWSLDFLSDAFTDGRRLRNLAVVDDFTRECLALVADTSLAGQRVVRELEAVIIHRGRPAMCVSDNGTELTGMAILRWTQETRISWHYIAPGKPRVSTAGCPTNCSTRRYSLRLPRPIPVKSCQVVAANAIAVTQRRK
jgi:transposase InsO family protein